MNSRSNQVAFVGGVGRTGSTLIELALGQIEDACPVGELCHIWQRGLQNNERCGCGAAFDACPFWIAVGEKAFGGWQQVDVDRVLRLKHQVDRTRHVPRMLSGRLGDPFSRRVREYTDLYQEIYAAARAVSGRPLIIDSSKHVSTAACLAHADDIDLKVVHVVRHPLGVAHSWSKLRLRPEITSHDVYMPRYSPGRVSLQWDSRQVLFELLRVRKGVDQFLVRYEDFVASPKTVLRGIAGFLEVGPHPDWTSDPTSHRLHLGVQHTIAGNPLRFDRGPVEVRLDEGWRTGLSPRAKATVLALTFPLTLRYGYVGSAVRARPGML